MCNSVRHPLGSPFSALLHPPTPTRTPQKSPSAPASHHHRSTMHRARRPPPRPPPRPCSSHLPRHWRLGSNAFPAMEAEKLPIPVSPCGELESTPGCCIPPGCCRPSPLHSRSKTRCGGAGRTCDGCGDADGNLELLHQLPALQTARQPRRGREVLAHDGIFELVLPPGRSPSFPSRRPFPPTAWMSGDERVAV
jgi:hypothetical protein